MITCNFKGELGNNLFQLAALLGLDRERGHNKAYVLPTKRDCYISNEDRPIEFSEMFENEFIFDDVSHNRIKSEGHMYLAPDAHGENINFGYTAIPDFPGNHRMCLDGYFQSPKYFTMIDCVSEFEPKGVVIEEILDKYSKLLEMNTVSFHIRRGGDREALKHNHGQVDLNFYSESLKIILELDSSIQKVLVFSDDISWCKENIPNPGYLEFIEGNKNYVDLFFMAMCTHNILANSTFSWWAAFLNKNKNKIVCAPSNEWFGPGLRHLYTGDMFPALWMTL